MEIVEEVTPYVAESKSVDNAVHTGATLYATIGAFLPVIMPFTMLWVVPIFIIVMLILVLAFDFSWKYGALLGYVATIPVTFFFLYYGTIAFSKAAPLLL